MVLTNEWGTDTNFAAQSARRPFQPRRQAIPAAGSIAYWLDRATLSQIVSWRLLDQLNDLDGSLTVTDLNADQYAGC